MRAAFAATVVVLVLAAGCVAPADSAVVLESTEAVPEFTTTAVFPGEYVTKGDFARVLVEGALGFLPQEIEVVASAYDGEPMEIGLVRPDVPEGTKVPVIVFASPYILSLHTVDFRERLARLTDNFVPHGYAVALVPVRGTANHGGCMDLMGPAERADLDQAITWLGEQPWSNGRIGMIGVSYDGSTPWEVAAAGNPYLKTIVPISGVNDIYHLMYHNGTAESRGSVILNALYYQYGFVENNPANGRDAEHTVTGVVCPEALKGFEASAYSAFTGERDPLGFWTARNSRPGVEASYTGSIFLVHGLQDWNVDPSHDFPWVTSLDEKGLRVKYLLGQWGHAWPDSRPEDSDHARWDWAEILLHWFDAELKGKVAVDVGPAAQVEDSSGRWRSESMWPPADTTPATFHLNGDGTLAAEPGAKGEFVLGGPVMGSVLDVVACPGCAQFESEAFETDFRFAGISQLPLTVTPTGPGGSVAAHLYAVGSGDPQRVAWGQLDLRFADGGEKASVVVPGQPITLRMELEPADVVVPAGSHLVLVVGMGTYADHLPSLPPTPVRLAVGDGTSALTVHTFERGEEVFFVPPGKSAP